MFQPAMPQQAGNGFDISAIVQNIYGKRMTRKVSKTAKNKPVQNGKKFTANG